jgi:hypothetical protein
VQLADRDQRVQLAVVTASALLLAGDVCVDRARDRPVRVPRLMLVDSAARSLSWPIRAIRSLIPARPDTANAAAIEDSFGHGAAGHAGMLGVMEATWPDTIRKRSCTGSDTDGRAGVLRVMTLS